MRTFNLLLAMLAAGCIGLFNVIGLTVTSSNFSGQGALREGIAATALGGTIDFVVTGTVMFTGGELVRKEMRR